MTAPAPAGPEVEISGEPTALYRFYDTDDVLLYVGVTNNPTQRFGQHAIDKAWWPQVARKTAVLYGSRDDALAAEAVAIVAESPVYNIAGRPRSHEDITGKLRRLERQIEDAERALRGPSDTFRLDKAFLASIDAYAGKYEVDRGTAFGMLLWTGILKAGEDDAAHEAELAALRTQIEEEMRAVAGVKVPA